MRAPHLHPLELGVEPGLPALALGVVQVARVLEVGLEDGEDVHRHRVAVLPVVLGLEEELEELAARRLLVGGRVRVDHPRLVVELGERRLPHRADGLRPHLEDVGVALVRRRVLVDVARGAPPHHHLGGLAGGPRRERLEIVVRGPARRQDRLELLPELEHAEHLRALQRGLALGVEEAPAVGADPHVDVLVHEERDAGEREAVVLRAPCSASAGRGASRPTSSSSAGSRPVPAR